MLIAFREGRPFDLSNAEEAASHVLIGREWKAEGNMSEAALNFKIAALFGDTNGMRELSAILRVSGDVDGAAE